MIFQCLTFSTVWVKLAEDKLIFFFFYFPEHRVCYFMQIVPLGNSLHMSNNNFWGKKKKKYFKILSAVVFYPAC